MDPASFPGGHGRSWTTAGAPPGRRACLRRSARRAGSAAIAAHRRAVLQGQSGPGGRLVVCPPAGGDGLSVWT